MSSFAFNASFAFYLATVAILPFSFNIRPLHPLHLATNGPGLFEAYGLTF
jgi:hypothetical protein